MRFILTPIRAFAPRMIPLLSLAVCRRIQEDRVYEHCNEAWGRR
jgi:hypothetical protein